MGPKPQDLTADQEVDLGRRILELEQILRTTLDAIPACRSLLARQGHADGSTRHKRIHQLAQANLLAQRTEGVDPRLLSRAASAISSAQRLRWRLAASAERVGLREANRRSSPALSSDDLEQEAMLGLYAAARRFNPERAVRFGA